MTGSPAGAGDGKSGRRVTAHVTPGCRPASWSDVDSEAAVWLGTLGPAGPVCGLPGPRAPPSVGLAEGREASQCASGRPRARLRAPFPVPLLRPRAPRLLPRPADLSRAVGGHGAVPANSGAWTRVKSWGKTFVPCLLRVDLSSALGRECRALPRPAAPSCHILRFRSAISARQAIAVPTVTNEGATPTSGDVGAAGTARNIRGAVVGGFRVRATTQGLPPTRLSRPPSILNLRGVHVGRTAKPRGWRQTPPSPGTVSAACPGG